MNTQEQPEAIPTELTEQVQKLVNVAFEDGPEKALQQARDTGNAALVDALHAELSKSEVHDELVRRQKIKPAA